jgi:thiamine-monophosphate kinase
LKLSRLGERKLVARIRDLVGKPPKGIVIGIGDDAAVFRRRPGFLSVLTTDALVEGIHFDLSYTPPDSLGWKSLVSNISDVAAMGGIPQYAAVSLAIPRDRETGWVESFYRGMIRCGKDCGCTVVGGDTVESKSGLFISVTVTGEVKEKQIVTRSGAKPGDIVCVLGDVGKSRAGLEVLERGIRGRRFSRCVRHFLEPPIRLPQIQDLISRVRVSSMIDVSDGLASEISHLAEESGLGCEVWEDRIPVDSEAILWAKESNHRRSLYSLESGEEYTVCFTLNPKEYRRMDAVMNAGGKVPVTAIGKMTVPGQGRFVQRDGERQTLSCTGWDHFSS